MAQSYKNRFNGNKELVLQDVKKYGYFKALRLHGDGDYLCFRKWVDKETNDLHYGDNPTFGFSAESQDSRLAKVIKMAIIEDYKRIEQLEMKIADLQEQNDFLKGNRQRQFEGDITGILELCGVKV